MKYIASCSGGKDSIATVILAHENNEPLDLIIFSEVMFDENISGEFPEHIDFIKNKAFPLFETWGYETKILHSHLSYLDIFYRHPIKGKYKDSGLRKGFPLPGKCFVNSDCKMKPIRALYKKIDKYIEYIGIAIDEPKRLERILENNNKISLLYKYGYTEEMAKQKCKEYELLSPLYKYMTRNGCWFCPNANEQHLKYLRTSHKDLWNKLLELENESNLIGNKWNTLSNISIHDMERYFLDKEKQLTFFKN